MAFNFNTSGSDMINVLEGLFGSSSSGSQNVSGSGRVSGTTYERTEVDLPGVMKAVTDLMEDPNSGLASIYGAEKNAGLFNSSSAKFGANDLMARIAGTIAQLTARKRTDTNQVAEQNTQTSSSTKKKGLLSKLFSDERLKSNIQRIGETAEGIPWYSYEIGGKKEEGVMAQELLFIKPEAVYFDKESGFLQVDYSKIQ